MSAELGESRHNSSRFLAFLRSWLMFVRLRFRVYGRADILGRVRRCHRYRPRVARPYHRHCTPYKSILVYSVLTVLLVALGLFWLWVRNGLPRGIAGTEVE